MSNRKLAIVGKIFRLLENVADGPPVDVNNAMATWWMNIRNTGGMRLTTTGYTIFHDILKLESWAVDLTAAKPMITKKFILDLDKKLEWPYYIDIKNKKIIFFGSREALMATMYGDVKRWLDSVDKK